jgi:hypothetical protein
VALLNDRRMISASTELPTEADVARLQEFFASPLPKDWVSWARECGSVVGLSRALLGLRSREDGLTTDDAREDALDLLMLLRLTEPSFPRDLLPMELLPERQLHCVVVGAGDSSPVVLVDLDRPEVRVDAARSVIDFVYDWRNDLHVMAAVIEEAGKSDDDAEDVLLRPDDWSTRRLCSQNVIVGLLQTRHNRDTNEHEVALFATATLTAFAPGAATRWALTTMLTEAHQVGGSLAVNFVRRSRINGKLDPHRTDTSGQRIPSAILRWASTHGVRLDRRASRWDHETGERLFIAATLLPDSLRALLPHSGVAPSAVCAAVSTGAWPPLDVEVVLRWAAEPARVLSGAVPVADRLRYLADQHVVRSAIILASLLRHLQRAGQPSASDEDDTIRGLGVAIAEPTPFGMPDRTLGAATFIPSGEEPLLVGWPRLAGPECPRPPLTVRILAVEADLLAEVGPDVITRMTAGEALLVPADAVARSHQLGHLYEAAQQADVTVFAAPDYTTSMDVTIATRLDRSRMSRQ